MLFAYMAAAQNMNDNSGVGICHPMSPPNPFLTTYRNEKISSYMHGMAWSHFSAMIENTKLHK